MELAENIEICLQTRELGVKTLVNTLREFENKNASEKEVKDSWLNHLTTNKSVFNQGWYDPPPEGTSVLCANKSNLERLSFPCLRFEEYWPKTDIFVDLEDPTFFYCSPVDKNTGVIGDFSVTLYRGDDQKIKDHFRKCLGIARAIADYAKVGMRIKEVYNYAVELFEKNMVNNFVYSINDPLDVNIGHTIPWTNEPMMESEKELLKSGDWSKIKKMISKKRIFVNAEEELRIPENMVFSIEPRLSSPDSNIPTPTFHVLVVVKDGKKTVVDNFDDVFKEFGVEY